ncbi:unnamed protein product [Rotaria sp. Silwood1]|nr:unnamed protein product [Rotaria sp. Silwood1]CAF1622417.1 unnamed protein product [Rotaria sp. Silwood1]CAF3828264.1 unnamed protein product [Rotaria sp. Silwood1]CAF4818990.1 unnamed protein product [Rotaria sp. Silwood1]
MQPYPYAGYSNANGATIPVGYMAPYNYQPNGAPLVNKPSDRHAGKSSSIRPSQYTSHYPSNTVPPGYRSGYPPTGFPPQPISTMMPGMPPNQPYYYPSNGLNPTVPPPGTKTKTNGYTMGSDGTQNEAIKGLVSNSNINDLLNHQGTKVKVSKIYRITKTKPDIHKNDSSDDDLEKLPSVSARTGTTKPATQPPVSAQRIPSVASSCSHCSTCSNCSCSECRNQEQGNYHDDCSECRAERAREQAQRQNRK